MYKIMKIIVDTLLDDYGPKEVIKGTIKAASTRKDVHFILIGDEKLISSTIKEEKADIKQFTIVNSNQAILNTEHPVMAFKQKPNSSLALAYDLLRKDKDIDALVTPGSTGAALAGGIFKIGRIQGIHRPALMATLPTRKDGKLVRILDIGANMDCKAEYLVQFAEMASEFLKLNGIASPKIGLLNVGKEEGKGNSLTTEAYTLLKENKNINFCGNIEGDGVLKGEVDAVVCDGFAGNVFLKSLEETAYFVSDAFTHAIKKNAFTKFGALFQLKELKKVKGLFKYANQACAPLLGLKRLVVKMHGKSTAENVYAVLLETFNMIEGNLINKIEQSINK